MHLAPTLAAAMTPTGMGWVYQTVFQSVVTWSFTFVFIGMVVGTVYFFLRLREVSPDHRGTLIISGCITLAASISYLSMRLTYVPGQSFPIEFRYADWTITTPLLLLKFVSMLDFKYVKKSTIWVMLLADVFMIVTGYIGISALQVAPGETVPGLTWVMFVVSMLGWFVVIGVLMGPIRAAIPKVQPEIGTGVKAMLVFPTLLWSVYPIAYLLRALGSKHGFDSDLAQLIQNLADFVNKVLFGVVSVSAVRAATLATDRRALRSDSSAPALALGQAGIHEPTIDDPALPADARASMRAADDMHEAEIELGRTVRHM